MAARVVDGALSRRSIELPSSYTIPPVLSPAALRACLCLSLLPILSLLSSSRSPLHPTPTANDSSLVVATFMCKAKRIPPSWPRMTSPSFLPRTRRRYDTIRYDMIARRLRLVCVPYDVTLLGGSVATARVCLLLVLVQRRRGRASVALRQHGDHLLVQLGCHRAGVRVAQRRHVLFKVLADRLQDARQVARHIFVAQLHNQQRFVEIQQLLHHGLGKIAAELLDQRQ